MSSVGTIPYRDDIEKYIIERGQVSIDEIYRKFSKESDIEPFQRELDILVDKSKKACEKGQEYCIVFDGTMYSYICKKLK